jgi:hypothetical protein
MKNMAGRMALAIPAKAAIATVLKSNRNKLFYTGELFKAVNNIVPISYACLCSALTDFPSVNIVGTYKRIYGHPTTLKKLKKELKNPKALPPMVNTNPVLVASRVFDNYRKRVFTPAELYTEFVKDKYNINKSTLKAALLHNFPRISLARTYAYYGHTDALKMFEDYLKKRKLDYKVISQK